MQTSDVTLRQRSELISEISRGNAEVDPVVHDKGGPVVVLSPVNVCSVVLRVLVSDSSDSSDFSSPRGWFVTALDGPVLTEVACSVVLRIVALV